MVGKGALRGIARQRFRKAELAPGMVGRRKGCRAGLTMGPQRGRGAGEGLACPLLWPGEGVWPLEPCVACPCAGG